MLDLPKLDGSERVAEKTPYATNDAAMNPFRTEVQKLADFVQALEVLARALSAQRRRSAFHLVS